MICEGCGCEMVRQEGCERCPICGEGPACGGVTIHTGVDVGSAGVPGAGLEPALREGDNSLGSDGGESPRLPDGSPMPEDLARQVRFLEGYLARRQDVPAEEIPACIERFIRGRREHNFSPDWRGIDFAAEIAEEQRDIWNYGGMEAMREAGV